MSIEFKVDIPWLSNRALLHDFQKCNFYHTYENRHTSGKLLYMLLVR